MMHAFLYSGAPEVAAVHHAPSMGVTLLFTGILIGLILCLALEEKIHAQKSVIAGIFALLSLALGTLFDILPFGPEAASKGAAPLTNAFHETIFHPIFVQGIDWGVISIIFGASLFVDITSKSGLFTWIALKLTKASGGDPRKLLWSYGFLTVVFSAVLNNVTAMIIVGSLSVVSLERLNRRNLLLGFLLIEGLLTNVGGLLTLISSVPNIIVGTAASISFGRFFIVAAPFVIVATVITIWIGAHRFKILSFITEEERREGRALVEQFDENEGIDSRGFFIFSSVMTILFILTIAMTSMLPGLSKLGMAYVALAFAGIMLLRFKSEASRFYEGIDWDLLGFFAALFVVINVMEHAQVLHLIGEGLFMIIQLGDLLGGGALLIASSAFSSVTDNIPLAAMLAKILSAQDTASDSSLWWSVIFGANLGGNLTPIGSASTLVAVTMMHKHKLEMSFGKFVVTAFPYAVIQLIVATAYVLIFL
jgi:Na+/H+ antiporter NhaD/arsenite permease-like protein